MQSGPSQKTDDCPARPRLKWEEGVSQLRNSHLSPGKPWGEESRSEPRPGVTVAVAALARGRARAPGTISRPSCPSTAPQPRPFLHWSQPVPAAGNPKLIPSARLNQPLSSLIAGAPVAGRWWGGGGGCPFPAPAALLGRPGPSSSLSLLSQFLPSARSCAATPSTWPPPSTCGAPAGRRRTATRSAPTPTAPARRLARAGATWPSTPPSTASRT